MSSRKRPLVLVSLLLLGLVTAGCGGGGSSSSGSGLGASSTTATAVNLAYTSSPDIIVGGTAHLQANATYKVGSQPEETRDMTSSATWASSNAAVATVAGGVVTGKSMGAATISASIDGHTGSKVVVVGQIPTSVVSATPGTFSVGTHRDQVFHLTATYPDGNVLDLGNWVGWSSSDVTVLKFYDANDFSHGPGEALLLQAGTATVKATMSSGEVIAYPVTVVP
jgi:hypothetical protein